MLLQVIVMTVLCAIASGFLYGIWLVDNHRYEFRKKHGVDPKWHGWKVDENDEDQDK